MPIPIKPKGGISLPSLRVRSPRQVIRPGSSRVKDNLTLSPLRATSGPPAGVLSLSSGLTQSDGGRRSTSLFDLPRSGQGLLSKLQAQVRPTSPLTAGVGSSSSATDRPSVFRSSSVTNRGTVRSIFSSSLISQQRSRSSRIDSGSRFLLAQSNARRSNAGFGINLTSSTLSIFG